MTKSGKFKNVVKQALPRAFKTIWWIFKITAIVSFIMFLLKYTGILAWIAAAVSPVFRIFGLPGDASLAYVSGYFINVYSCIAVVSTIDLTARQITILGTMTLAAHAMVVETAVQCSEENRSSGLIYSSDTNSGITLFGYHYESGSAGTSSLRCNLSQSF